jgi:hypothetical protein
LHIWFILIASTLGGSLATSKPAGSSIPVYFSQWDWTRRIADIVAAPPASHGNDFVQANARLIRQYAALQGADAKVHVVFNLGAIALLDFLQHGDYKNVYERPVVNGRVRIPSNTRIKVDQMLGLDPPEAFYFCALAAGGTGIRFYGEYCVVLKSPEDSEAVARVLDRNSYELIQAPLSQFLTGLRATKRADLIRRLGAAFRHDECGELLAVKVLQATNGRTRLLTAGTVGEAILDGEDYVEAYHRGKIEHGAVLEIRESPFDQQNEASISARFGAGDGVGAEEILWVARRQQVRNEIEKCGLERRVVADNGRTERWR